MNPCQLGKALDEISVWYDDEDGRLEHGCGIASHYMDSVTTVTGCTAPTNKMAVTFANSDVDGYFEHSRWSTSSTCTTKFAQRMGVGTHVCAEYKDCDLDDFANAGVYYVKTWTKTVTLPLLNDFFSISDWRHFGQHASFEHFEKLHCNCLLSILWNFS